MLDYMINSQDQSIVDGEEQMQRQMQYIYNQLNSEAEPVLEVHSDVEDEDDDFEDAGENDEELSDDEIFEEDEDFNDTMKIEGVLIGEEWLTS